MLKEVFITKSFKARSLLSSLLEKRIKEKSTRVQMKRTSVTIVIDLAIGPVSAESLYKDTPQEVIEDKSDRDQDLLQDRHLQSEEKDQEKDHQLNTMNDKTIKDLLLRVLLLEKKKFLKKLNQNQ
mgnify:FL=1